MAKKSFPLKTKEFIEAQIHHKQQVFESKLKIRKGETQSEWKKRTEKLRNLHEKDMERLNKELLRSKSMYITKLPVQKTRFSRLQIQKKEFKHLKNTLLIFVWAEMRYKIDRMELFFILHLYGLESSFHRKQIKHLAYIFNMPHTIFNSFVERGILKETGPEEQDINKKIYVLSLETAMMCHKLYRIVLGIEKPSEITEIKTRNPNIESDTDLLYSDILKFYQKEIS
jgi:hypothetical protein